MTTKIQREAYSLTLLAADLGLDFAKGDARQRTMMMNVAKESGIAVMVGESFGYDHYVFVPQDEAREAGKKTEMNRRFGVEDANMPMRLLVERYYRKAMAYAREI